MKVKKICTWLQLKQERRQASKYHQMPKSVYVQRFETVNQSGSLNGLDKQVPAEDEASETVGTVKWST